MKRIPCRKCKGLGTLAHYNHVENGICFTCSGSKFEAVSETEYNNYLKDLAIKAKGQYILFNNGSIEYYKTTKAIEKQYGTFYTGSYGTHCTHNSYKDDNIVYTYYSSDKESELFIEIVQQEYINRQNKAIQDKINMISDLLKGETDIEWVTQFNEKIEELKQQLIL